MAGTHARKLHQTPGKQGHMQKQLRPQPVLAAAAAVAICLSTLVLILAHQHHRDIASR